MGDNVRLDMGAFKSMSVTERGYAKLCFHTLVGVFFESNVWVHCLSILLIFIVVGQGCQYRCAKMYTNIAI